MIVCRYRGNFDISLSPLYSNLFSFPSNHLDIDKLFIQNRSFKPNLQTVCYKLGSKHFVEFSVIVSMFGSFVRCSYPQCCSHTLPVYITYFAIAKCGFCGRAGTKQSSSHLGTLSRAFVHASLLSFLFHSINGIY